MSQLRLNKMAATPAAPAADKVSVFMASDLLVKYIDQNGVVRTVGDIVVNVKDYYAAGDGSTNDTTAIQNAINAAVARGVSARGVDVYFPPGVYRTTATLTVTGNNIYLKGSGVGSTVLYPDFTTTDILQFGNGVSTYASIGFKDMTIFAPSAHTSGSTININKCNDVYIQDFSINNCFTGVLIQGASIKVYVQNGTINNIYVTTGIGIQINNGAAGDTYITDIVMSNPPASKPSAGINILVTGHASLKRCNVTSCNYGLYVNPGASSDVNYLFIDHCLFDSCGAAGAYFYASNATAARIRSVMSVNSWYSGSAANYGIQFNTAGGTSILDALSFIGCRILNNYQHGVYIQAGTNISFTDCTIAGNGQQTINTYDGINIAAGVSSIQVMNCKIGQAGTATNQQRYAINVAAGASAGLVFAYNDCQPNGTLGTNGYIQLGAITGGGNVIINNLPVIPRSFGRARTAATSAITTTETIVTDTTAFFNRLMANGVSPGNHIRFTVTGTTTISTAAGTSQWRVRVGTNNTTADGVVLDSAAITTGGVGGPVAFRLTVDLSIRTVGGSGTIYGTFNFNQDATTGGITVALTRVINGTASTHNTANANYWNLTAVGSANCSITVQTAVMEVVSS